MAMRDIMVRNSRINSSLIIRHWNLRPDRCITRSCAGVCVSHDHIDEQRKNKEYGNLQPFFIFIFNILQLLKTYIPGLSDVFKRWLTFRDDRGYSSPRTFVTSVTSMTPVTPVCPYLAVCGFRRNGNLTPRSHSVVAFNNCRRPTTVVEIEPFKTERNAHAEAPACISDHSIDSAVAVRNLNGG